MTYDPRSALLLAACLLACGNGIGVTDASGVTAADSNPGTTDPGPSTGSSSTSAPTTGEPTTGGTGGTVGATGSSGPATDGTGLTATGSSTGDVPTTGGTGSTGSTGASDTGSTDTGAPVACINVGEADYGDCAAEIGIGFDGTTCRPFSGCDCAPNCDNFFPTMIQCVQSCAAAGECNEGAINGAGLARGPAKPGDSCDEVDACFEKSSETPKWLVQLFPNDLSCEGPLFPCEGGENCHLQFQGTISDELWKNLCAASLLPDVGLFCVIFGP